MNSQWIHQQFADINVDDTRLFLGRIAIHSRSNDRKFSLDVLCLTNDIQLLKKNVVQI